MQPAAVCKATRAIRMDAGLAHWPSLASVIMGIRGRAFWQKLFLTTDLVVYSLARVGWSEEYSSENMIPISCTPVWLLVQRTMRIARLRMASFTWFDRQHLLIKPTSCLSTVTLLIASNGMGWKNNIGIRWNTMPIVRGFIKTKSTKIHFKS